MKRCLACLLSVASLPAAAQTAGTTVLSVGGINARTLDSSKPLHTEVQRGLGVLIGIPESFDSPGTSISVGNATTLQVALSYFITDHLAITTEGGLPPKFYLRGKGTVQPNPNIDALSVDIGAAASNPIAWSRQWSPAVLMQYYFGSPEAQWRPILGVGVIYTFFTRVSVDRDFANDLNRTFGRSLALANLNFPIDGTHVKVRSTPDWAPIANVGMAYAFDRHWGATLSVSYVDLKTTSKIDIYGADGKRLSHSETDLDLDPLATALLVTYAF